ncbi:MAG: GNAT family N-acetyltransferase [Rhodocyclaceae bacterium]|nr:GNAT family N-acetyltransferase [Rhodocyclaceae bacterium]
MERTTDSTYAPQGPIGEAFCVSAAEPQDEPFLWLMLTYAASMGGGGEEQISVAQADPYLRTYVAEWGSRPGDLGVVARDGDGRNLGAAWLRLGGGGSAFKLSDSTVPELATAVVPDARGTGVGTAMMRRLIADAVPLFGQMVLSVRAENPASRFYQRLGFTETTRMTNRVGGDSLVMALRLR